MEKCKLCNKPANASLGMCNKHYIWDYMSRKKHKCKIDECNKHVFSEGLCKKHYAMSQICKAVDCTHHVDAAKGYCWKHYQRIRRSQIK